MRKTVVVAHYNEDLDWCIKLSKDYDIRIYSKTNKNFNFIDNNKGQEIPMYLKYIIDNYNNLSDKTLFLHGHKTSHHQDYSSDFIIQNVNWNLNDFFSVNRRNCYQEVSSTFEYSEGAFNNWLRNNWNVFENELKFPEDGLFFYSNAQFVVDKKLILQYKLDFWIKLYDWISNTDLSNIISSRIFEYVWHYIFTKKTKEDIIDNIFVNKKMKSLYKSLINFNMEDKRIDINPAVTIGDCDIVIRKIDDTFISSNHMTIEKEFTYWIEIVPNKKDLEGIQILIYKENIIIYEEHIYF